MIKAFDNALRTIFHSIPMPILEEAFRPRDFQASIDQRIKDVIVEGRVLPDCNITAGMIKRIPLYQCMQQPVLPAPGYQSLVNPSPGTLYKVPPQARENRDITGVIDISYPYDYTGFNDTPFGFGINGNDVMGLAGSVLDSHTHRNACLTPSPRLMADNMVLISPANVYFSDWTLICRLAYDGEFTNISNSSILPLSKLILTATKAYIWMTLTIRIDQAMLSGGQEIGQFKTIVDSYQGEAERYDEDLLKFRGSTVWDPEAIPLLITLAL